jgi:hypothetical protein
MLEKLHVVENESLTSAGHGMAWHGTAPPFRISHKRTLTWGTKLGFKLKSNMRK